ncbi:MAG: hypothetical protein ABEH38_06575 [Flavobacteriales bacterium]
MSVERSIPVLLRAFLLLSMIPLSGEAQKADRFTAFGLQYRPILATPLLDTGPFSTRNEEFSVKVTPELGHDFGMVLRWGIDERFAIETGIDQIRRNFRIEVKDRKSDFKEQMRFEMLAYQLPLRALLYVQLGKKLYTNAAVGVVGDIFPTDWSISRSRTSQFTQRFNWLIGGFTANVGFEYRTDENGSLYFGGTYHRPLSDAPHFRADIGAMRVRYKRNKRALEQILLVPGNYITLDFKYFFPVLNKSN